MCDLEITWLFGHFQESAAGRLIHRTKVLSILGAICWCVVGLRLNMFTDFERVCGWWVDIYKGYVWVSMWFDSSVYVCMYLERVCVVGAACGRVMCVFQCCPGAGVVSISVLFDFSLKCNLAVNQSLDSWLTSGSVPQTCL